MLGNEKIIGFLSCLFQRSVCCRQKRAFLKEDFFLSEERFWRFSFFSKKDFLLFPFFLKKNMPSLHKGNI